ncbi:MAG: MBL fold metallo-hydrolase [Bacteroidales bacterium]|nr:MBL fold metallo-hydrolase [Bacteroidales bacterium]
MKIKKLVFSPIEVNTYILSDDSGDSVIIDCGCYDEQEFDKLKAYIVDNDLRPVMLLNTHLHLDHIFGNHFMLKEYGLRTHAAREEEPNLSSAPLHAEMFGLSMPEPPGAGEFVSGGQVLTAGDIKLKCLFVPGHTAGSIAYYCEEENCVFSGDTLFAGGIGRTDLPGGDHGTLLSSIGEQLLVLDGDTAVYPGHGPETTIAAERKSNPFLT